ncbi:divalent metal cation transporter [Rubritalea tangerina]|uniref:Divalent metal cation transporter n=1 Tax=Rubritalea tangerina TaxID=430798 RepID=A0ABW4Z708_9BACT
MEDLQRAREGGFLTKLGIYAKLSGPGWVQAAVTLGGGSLVGALYLGVIGGYEFLWLQPLAMLCGIIMLSAISYVTLSTDERPFRLVEKKVSPSLAWGWLIATVVADTVFCAAQFSLGRGALEGNLGVDVNPYVITGSFFVIALSLLGISQRGGKASAILDNTLKGLVAVIVLAFMAVVVTLVSKGAVDMGHLFRGLVPDFSALFRPTEQIGAAIGATGDASGYWTEYVTAEQRSKIISAFGTAVGINMTFLLPYSLKKKGWRKQHRELSRYDLVLGLFVPFILGASALVIASASSFHAKYADVLDDAGKPLPKMEGIYYEVIDKKLAAEHVGFAEFGGEQKSELRAGVPMAERQLAAMLSNRKASNLASSLEPFLGKYAQLIFGVGVLAMAISTMLVHMMMNGYAISEAVNKVGSAKVFMLGAAMPAVAGLFSPILWAGESKAAMAVPASVIATTLLPIAYLAFLLLMNSKSVLGDEMPRRRGVINVLMVLSAGVASFASIWALSGKGVPGQVGMGALAILVVVGVLGFVKRNRAEQ